MYLQALSFTQVLVYFQSSKKKCDVNGKYRLFQKNKILNAYCYSNIS